MIPTVDLAAWRTGDPDIGPAVDAALRQAGFLLVRGHGVDPALGTELRAAARLFFTLPAEVKAGYAVRIGGRGWLAPGVEANGRVEGVESPPDLKESFAVGPDTRTGDPAVDDVWFPPNVAPTEVPELTDLARRYTAAMTVLSLDLLGLCAAALQLPPDSLTALATRPTWTFNINRYPPLTEVGAPPIGRRADLVPVRSAPFLRERLDAISVP